MEAGRSTSRCYSDSIFPDIPIELVTDLDLLPYGEVELNVEDSVSMRREM